MEKHIHYWQVTYIKDPKFKYFNVLRSSSPSLPQSISIQETMQRHRISAPYVAYDRISRKFLTGLKHFYQDWYYGDIRNSDRKEFLLFLIRPGEVVVYHFAGFYPESPEIFSRGFIWDIKRPEN
jgi:hypothetical protein